MLEGKTQVLWVNVRHFRNLIEEVGLLSLKENKFNMQVHNGAFILNTFEYILCNVTFKNRGLYS